MTDCRKIGREVILQEADALSRLAAHLGPSFDDAVACLKATIGRVIITGMGKSGHIAKKIAATMASTGTPAHFVHPGEASHGDMGMIIRHDTVIAISFSGESRELYDLLNYCKKNSIPVIGMTKNPESTLAKMSSIALIYPMVDEACPLGLAPTTSTTMSLALGDALSVALYYDKFTPIDFSQFHPGGKLGSNLLKVEHLMHTGKGLPIVNHNQTVGEAIIEMTEKSFGIVAVMENENIIGVVSDGDLRRHMDGLNLTASVDTIMNSNPKTISCDKFATEAMKLMNHYKITSLLILQSKKLIGILHMHDCVRAGVEN